jgi:glycosyltransferase involved in cell wall biosynthesis
MSAALFSIVIPVFNRAHTIRRCLRSVFSQGFGDFEVLAVDDGSSDGSLALLHSVGDARLRVIAHETNRGVCPARNTAIRVSTAPWLVFLDSDDEFSHSDALARMAGHARGAPDELHALWFRSRLDDGRVAPDPMPAETELDYLGYVRFLEATFEQPKDMIRCVRRSCFDVLLYPESRMLEDKFHLDFAMLFRSRIHSDILRLYHQDAGNQLVDRLGQLSRKRDAALLSDRTEGLRQMLDVHGTVLAREAPRLHRATRLRTLKSALRNRSFDVAARQAVSLLGGHVVAPGL